MKPVFEELGIVLILPIEHIPPYFVNTPSNFFFFSLSHLVNLSSSLRLSALSFPLTLSTARKLTVTNFVTRTLTTGKGSIIATDFGSHNDSLNFPRKIEISLPYKLFAEK